MNLSLESLSKLETQQNLWFGSVRAGGRPHLVPVWFIWHDEKIYISTDKKSVKVRNILHNPQVVVALEDGNHPIIGEGTARLLSIPYPQSVLAAFYKKYEWDIPTDPQYNLIVEVTPSKWLAW